MIYEKAPGENKAINRSAPSAAKNPDTATVRIPKAGDPIYQDTSVGHYESLGYEVVGDDKAGAVYLSKPKKTVRERYLADQQEARDRLKKTTQADRAEFGDTLIPQGSGVVMKKESAQEAYAKSVDLEGEDGKDGFPAGFARPTGAPTTEDKFDEQ